VGKAAVGGGGGFSPRTSVFSCDYHSTNAPYSPSSAHCSYQQKKKGLSLGTFQKAMLFSKSGRMDGKVLSNFFFVFE